MSIATGSPVSAAQTASLDVNARVKLIGQLTRLVLTYEASGMLHRQAVREAAKTTGLHPMIIRRLIDLYPET